MRRVQRDQPGQIRYRPPSARTCSLRHADLARWTASVGPYRLSNRLVQSCRGQTSGALNASESRIQGRWSRNELGVLNGRQRVSALRNQQRQTLLSAFQADPRSKRLFLLIALGHLDQLARAGPRSTAQLSLRRPWSPRQWRPLLRLSSLLVLGPGEALAAQADLAIGRVDAEDLDLDLVADLDHFLRALDLVVGQLGDVQQPSRPGSSSTNTPKLVSLVTLPFLMSPGW